MSALAAILSPLAGVITVVPAVSIINPFEPALLGFDAEPVTKTSTAFNSYHIEGGTDANLSYNGTIDLAQSTSDDILSEDVF